MTKTLLEYIIAPIYITDIKYEMNNPIYSLGSHSPIEYGAGTISGGFRAVDPDALNAIMASVHGQARVYLVNTNNIVEVIHEFEDNLPKYLTSPHEADRLLAQTIARLKGIGNHNKKEKSLASTED